MFLLCRRGRGNGNSRIQESSSCPLALARIVKRQVRPLEAGEFSQIGENGCAGNGVADLSRSRLWKRWVVCISSVTAKRTRSTVYSLRETIEMQRNHLRYEKRARSFVSSRFYWVLSLSRSLSGCCASSGYVYGRLVFPREREREAIRDTNIFGVVKSALSRTLRFVPRKSILEVTALANEAIASWLCLNAEDSQTICRTAPHCTVTPPPPLAEMKKTTGKIHIVSRTLTLRQ